MNPLSLFFSPRGVALIGASQNPEKLSYGILKNMLEYGYQGKIFPVNPTNNNILGLPSYKDILKVPDPLDLAVIILPATTIPEIVEMCGVRGIKAITIISGGFREVGTEGAKLEANIMSIASKYGIRIIGPNCVGTVDLYSGLNTTFIKGLPDRGGIGFISQSGAVCGGIVDYYLDKGGGFSHFISLGNEADVTETDMIEYLGEVPQTRVIAVYAEAIKDGRRFLEMTRRISKIKPIVILKAGQSEAGAKAVSSHTGSLAGSNIAYITAFKQSGALIANSVTDLFEIAYALSIQPLPKGNKTTIITNAGGPAALASDALADNGISLVDLDNATQSALRGYLNSAAQVSNPVDMLGGAKPSEYAFTLKQVINSDNVDSMLVIHVPQALVNPADVASEICNVASTTNKPIISCFMGDSSIKTARIFLQKGEIPMYSFPESAGRALGIMNQYANWKNMPSVSPEKPVCLEKEKVRQNLEKVAHRLYLGEYDTRSLLEAYDIPVISGSLATSGEEALIEAQKIGFPVVLKISSPDILHKSETEGIRLGINSPDQICQVFQELVSTVRSNQPEARINGILVEKMAPRGHEVIVGVKRDPNFGPLIMFGLGGVYVELIADLAFRVAPISRQEAKDMISQTKAGRLLSGIRGENSGDIDAVIDCIVRLGSLSLDFPEIEEIEINPLRVFSPGKGVVALDARAILSDFLIYHICSKNDWLTSIPTGIYTSESLYTEGFIHCSTRQQVVGSAERHFYGKSNLVLLCVHPQRVEANIRFENTSGGTDLFPHIYGPLNTSSVINVLEFNRDNDGRYRFPF